MRLRTLSLLLALVAVPATAAPATALAQNLEASSNMSHVKTIPSPLRYESSSAGGSDLEFGTLTVAGPKPVAPPVTPPAPKAKAKKKVSKYAACVKKAKKIKSKTKRKRALRKCAKLKKKTRARSSQADVDTSKPGVQRTFAFVGSYNNGLHIVDVSDQANPTLVNSYDCGLAQGDVQVFTRNDYPGRTFVAFAADDGYALQTDSSCVVEADKLGYSASSAAGKGTFIIDVTDPLKPFTVSFMPFDKGSHNQTVHPSGKYLYNSNSDIAGTDPGIEVADITDLTKPKLVTVLKIVPLPGLGSDSHDISFNADGTRAYSAAVSQGLVIDTTDPANPSIMSRVYDPAVNVWHQAEAMDVEVPGLGKRTILIGADEFAGATGTGQCPNGGLHLYDITGPNEQAPVKLGYFNIDEARPTSNEAAGTCTAHVYELHREAQIMLIAWYNAGARVLDIASMAGVAFGGNGQGIKEIGFARFPDSSIWSVKAPRGSVKRDGTFTMYGNDQTRGLDVFKFDGSKTRAARGVTFIPAGGEPPVATDARLRLVCQLV